VVLGDATLPVELDQRGFLGHDIEVGMVPTELLLDGPWQFKRDGHG